MNKPIFRSAITDENGDVDVGYLALMWGLIGWSSSVVVVLGIGIFAVWRDHMQTAGVLSAMGTAQISISTGFAAMLGAVGLFRFGDKPRAAAPGSTTTTIEKKVEQTDAAPTATAAKPMPVIVKNPDPVAVRVAKPKGKR